MKVEGERRETGERDSEERSERRNGGGRREGKYNGER